MSERTLTVRLRAIVDGYERAMSSAAQSTDDFAARAEKVTGIGKRAEDTGKRMTTGLTLPIAAVGTAALFTAGNFEASMREVQALTGATAGEMAMLEAQATRMGAETQFAASDAADALGQLVKGGFNVQQAYDALPGVMQLAAAATIDIASAADIATNVLSGYGLEVRDLATVNDLLAQTANASDTDVRELGEAFKYVGPVARGAGLDLNETTAILGLFAENGIRGSMAGTALRGAITGLLAPTGPAAAILERLGINATDASGQLLPMAEILDQLADSGATTADIMAVFGDRAGPAMVALLSSGSDSLRQFTKMLDESGGVAQNLADAKMGGLNGSIEQLLGSLETLAIAVGDSGALSFVTALASGGAALANAMSGVPGPVLGGAVAIAAIAAASGPAIWAFGKMSQLYRPVVTGAQDVILKLMLMGEQFQLARAAGMSSASALGAAFGPQAAVIAGLILLGGLLVYARREAESYRRSHLDASESAVQLADAAGIATTEIGALNDETDRGVVSTDDWRKSVEDTILTLRSLGDEDLQQARLVEIGYQLVLRGATPDEAVQEVSRLALAAGIEVPVDLNVNNVSDFENQVTGAVARAELAAQRIAELGPGSDVTITKDIKTELDGIAQSAADAWQTDNIAGFVQILGAAGIEVGHNADAMNYLVDQALKYSDVAGLSTAQAEDLAGALAQLSGDASGATDDQKDLVDSIIETARGMEGGLTPANIAAAAAMKTAGYQATEFGSKARSAEGDTAGMAGAVDGADGALGDAAQSAEEFANQVTRVAAESRLASMDIEAGAAAADAFAKSIDNSTGTDNLMRSGLDTGSALRSLEEGLYGSVAGADGLRDSSDDAETAVDRLSDAAGRLDEGLTVVGIRMGTLEAAAEGFRRAMADSSGLDDQLSSAIDLGTAWREYSKIVRRLPAELDVAGIASGKYRGRQLEAIEAVLQLGQASTEYLATLLETGAGEDRVRGEAERLRTEYAAQLAQVGMNEEQVRRYLEVLGLTPSQVETAIKVSGEDAARFQIESYLQLLEGRIPDNVAASVVTAIEGDDLAGAAAQLADWARTNPVRVQVQTSVDRGSGDKAARELWDLPRDFDYATAALGRYSDAQQSAIDGVLTLGDSAKGFLSDLVGQGKDAEARELAAGLREQFASLVEPMNLSTEQLNRYYALMGIAPDQIETAIVLSGDAEAMFRIQMYNDLLGAEIPPEIQTQVLAAMDEGRLGDAANLLTTWRTDMQDGLADNPMIAQILGNTAPGQGSVEEFRTWVSNNPPDELPIGAITNPAEEALSGLQQWIPLFGNDVPVDSDTTQAEDDLAGLKQWIPLFGNSVPVDADTTPAEARLKRLAEWIPIFGVPGVAQPSWTPPPLVMGGGADGDPATPFAAGGRVRGPGSRTSDSIDARLSNDEFVIRASSASSVGYETLDAINRTGMIPGSAVPIQAPLVGAGAGFDDSRMVGHLESLSRTMAGIKRGITIEGDVVVPSATPARAAHALIDGIEAEAWAKGYDV